LFFRHKALWRQGEHDKNWLKFGTQLYLCLLPKVSAGPDFEPAISGLTSGFLFFYFLKCKKIIFFSYSSTSKNKLTTSELAEICHYIYTSRLQKVLTGPDVSSSTFGFRGDMMTHHQKIKI
jgi:hypothetical protein